jgi:hydrogenase expression/formation protein HypD
MSANARVWLDRIRSLPLNEPVSVMNVCGGHERSLSQAGLRAALPAEIRIIPGPGCPVCVCPEEDIFEAIRLGLEKSAIVVAFGDMLRVPVNVPKGDIRSLAEARGAGADIRPVGSPREAVGIARANPERTVVFFAAGFETTTAPVAGMIAEGAPDNLLLLLSGRRTWPAVAMLLDSEKPGFDALIAPGHVATVMGPEEWEFVASERGIPTAIAGFTADSLLAATYSVLQQRLTGRVRLDNCYGSSVRPGGNPVARRHLAETMEIVDANWRGIGAIPRSGFSLKEQFARHDARIAMPAPPGVARKRAGEMPPGCDCARVVLGKVTPTECRLYGAACTPRHPIGPCMVSDEGACHIWWTSGFRAGSASAGDAPQAGRAS